MTKEIIIFDTTLRDGEQAPGCSMNLNEKLAVAHQLAALGVDVIEAGFPIASQGDFEAVKAIATHVKGPVICGLSRANEKDIKRCGEALAPAEKKRIHTFIATSPIHMEHKLKMSPKEVLEKAVEAVKLAKIYTDDVEFSCEDASRSDIEFLQEICEAAIAAGATTINLPDTVGYDLPWEYAEFIQAVMEGIPSRDKAIFSVHCHNDLGLAVANSLAAVHVGARQIEVSVNGIGERAGNAALEEIVMAIKTREKLLGLHTNIKTEEIYRTSKLISQTTRMPIPANKAIVGRNAFLHESGIHQDGVLKERSTYEIMDPAMIGINKDNLVLGKHSGRHAFQKRLEQLGYTLDKMHVDEAFSAFKDLCDRKKEVLDEDIIGLVTKADLLHDAIYQLSSLQVTSATGMTAMASIKALREGKEIEVGALGQGPVDAAYAAIDALIKEDLPEGISLTEYRIDALTPGQDAQADVYVGAEYQGRKVHGRGISTSVLEASSSAYLDAINKILSLIKQQKS